MAFEIVNMSVLNETQLMQAAQILVDELPLGWPVFADAMREVNERWKGVEGAEFFAAVTADDGAQDGGGECANGGEQRDSACGSEVREPGGKPRNGANNSSGECAGSGEVIGWCGILPQYGGNVYELHPLAVRRDWQRKGVGTALVREAENAAARKGGLTMWIGADDEAPGGETSFANADLYDDLPQRIRDFQPGLHQTAFYMKLGYKITGVMPDANGSGKPDIYLAKRL